MFSIQKLFAKDDEFFQLLKASAEASRISVQTLKEILQTQEGRATLEVFATSRRRDKQITTKIRELLARTSITSLDRDDIESISYALYKIPKTVEKFAERYLICPEDMRAVSFLKQIEFAAQATEIVTRMIAELEKSQFEAVIDLNEQLQTIEGDADKLMVELLRELYKGPLSPMTVVIVKDLYELLERVIDRCRDAGNVVANVGLKHS